MTTSSTANIDATISALQGGLTSVPPSTAVTVIENFEQQLQGLDDPGATRIASSLTELKQLLTGGNASGPAIGQVLSQLGTQTSSAASKADSGLASKLTQLGELLSQAGSSLS
ncbi:hypothetical protein [Leptolyngbya sp. FACHB-261]|uniref:hypothetical protein n=1 Tax=Leptolyngbya sp. FACHB-261 TaxID=2692806 RepID=UPI001689F62C|nr:hypothetical protein [Leptolyngbya sp. FACHB-261]MBD2103279.1 hypothetical protein [Leptolyngbya sp. FACHB-261]